MKKYKFIFKPALILFVLTLVGCAGKARGPGFDSASDYSGPSAIAYLYRPYLLKSAGSAPISLLMIEKSFY